MLFDKLDSKDRAQILELMLFAICACHKETRNSVDPGTVTDALIAGSIEEIQKLDAKELKLADAVRLPSLREKLGLAPVGEVAANIVELVKRNGNELEGHRIGHAMQTNGALTPEMAQRIRVFLERSGL